MLGGMELLSLLYAESNKAAQCLDWFSTNHWRNSRKAETLSSLGGDQGPAVSPRRNWKQKYTWGESHCTDVGVFTYGESLTALTCAFSFVARITEVGNCIQHVVLFTLQPGCSFLSKIILPIIQKLPYFPFTFSCEGIIFPFPRFHGTIWLPRNSANRERVSHARRI